MMILRIQPGTSIDGAKWFVEHRVRGVGFDMQAIDHILYTYAADHGPGPYVPRICEEYEEQFGHPAKDDFPEWEPCHDILMANNVMGIENLGGDLDKVTNQRFLFCAFPLRWYMGDVQSFVPLHLFHLTESTEVYRTKSIRTAYTKS